MKAQQNTPWLDQNGKILSDEQIKSVSKNWTSETWESFLNSTVERELSAHEVLSDKYEGLCEQLTETNWGPARRLPQGVQKEINSSVRRLEERPRKIVRLQYWEDKSVREIAKIEALSFARIQQIKIISLNQIKDFLTNALHTPSYIIGGIENFSLPASRDEEIKEVYRVDLEGSYLK